MTLCEFTLFDDTAYNNNNRQLNIYLHQYARIMSALGRTAYLDQSTIIKQGCSSQGSYCVNDLR